MTLIAAFRCEVPGSPFIEREAAAGVVICADGQETVGDDFWVKVDKLKPSYAGEYEIAIGGSGMIGELIDGFVDTLPREVKKWPAGLDDDGVRDRIREVLLDFHANEVDLHTEKDASMKELEFIICLREIESGKIFLYKTRVTVVTPVLDYALIGFETHLYQNEIDRLHHTNLPITQAALLGLHVLSIAKKMTKWIGGNTTMIVAAQYAMWSLNQEGVHRVENSVEALNKSLGKLAFAAPDLLDRGESVEELFKSLRAQIERLVVEMNEGLDVHKAEKLFGSQESEEGNSGDPD